MKNPWDHLRIFSVTCTATGAFRIENIVYDTDDNVLKMAARISLCLNSHDKLLSEIERLNKIINELKTKG